MTLSEEIKQKITEEYNSFEEKQYAGKSREERAKLSQFYTPPSATIQMLELADILTGNILDPTCGCGGLLAAAIIAGADPKKCYGVELDPVIVEVCRERLGKLGVPKYNIHLGNAMNPACFDNFNEDYNYDVEKDRVTIKGKKPKKLFVFGY